MIVNIRVNDSKYRVNDRVNDIVNDSKYIVNDRVNDIVNYIVNVSKYIV